MVKAVLFDLDGTLLNTSEGVIESAKYAARQLGYSILPHSKMITFVGPPIQESFKRYYGIDDKAAQKAAEIFRDYYIKKAISMANIYPNVFDLFSRLKKKSIKIAVATYKREDIAIKMLDYFKMTSYCSVIHGADNLNKLKKSDIIEKCIIDLGIKKQETVLVGDTIHDAIGAEKIGISFIGVTYGLGFHSVEEVNLYHNIGCVNDIMEIDNIINYD